MIRALSGADSLWRVIALLKAWRPRCCGPDVLKGPAEETHVPVVTSVESSTQHYVVHVKRIGALVDFCVSDHPYGVFSNAVLVVLFVEV